MCDNAYCYEQKQCLADVNECASTECAGDTTCVNLLCSGLQPSCINITVTN